MGSLVLLASIVVLVWGAPADVEERRARHEDDPATGEQIFPSGAVELNEKRFLRLEDFYNKTNSIPQVHLERLILDVSMIQPDEADPEEFYKSCAKNLKKTAPNLKKVALEGGYQYYPSQPDHETIGIELEDVKAGTQLIIRAIHSAGIQLTSIVLTVSLFIPFPLVQDSNYPLLFKKIYNKIVTDYDLDRNVVPCLFTVDGIPVDVEFTFYNDRVFDKANKGRNPLILNRLPREKVISPAKEVHPRYFFTLEKFYSEHIKLKYAEDDNLQNVYYMLVTLLHDAKIRPDFFYRHAVQHLKEAAPGLKTLELWGGAAVHLKHGKLPELDAELSNLKQNLEAMLRAFRAVGIKIKKLDFEAYMNFAEDFIVSGAYPKMIKQLFGHVVSEREIAMEIVEMEVNVLDIPCHIKLNFYFEPSMINLASERMGYLHLPPWP